MTRDEALCKAIELVDKIAPSTNARGYTDGTAKLAERGQMILALAALMVTEAEESA